MRGTVPLLGAAVGFLLLVAAPALAGQRVPARVLHARYVALGYDLGDRFLSETDAIGPADRLTSEDRQAMQAVRQMIQKWDRYVITRRPGDAELVIALRVGRRMQAGTVQPVGRGEPAGRSSSGYGIELSSRDDMLSVYDRSPNGGLGTLLWRAQRAGGLSGATPELVEQLKADVNAAGKP